MLFALHEEQKRDIMSVFNVGEEKVKVIGSGFNDNIFKNKNYEVERDYIELVFAGKICKSKGLIPFIDCLDRLDYKDDFIKVRLAGTGSDKESYDEIVEKAKESRFDIKFLGKLNQDDLSEEFNKADIFVLPSFYEGLPVVVLEAMACGTDVVVTDIPGVKEWIGEKINTSGKIKYVKLPKMKSVGVPSDEAIEPFEERLAESLEQMIKENLDTTKHKRFIDMSEKTWDGLAKRMEEMIIKTK